MALHISRLRISNFRNFADCEISPFPAPAVIVGENGVGKSNLLHALRLVLDPDLPESARRLRADDIHAGARGSSGGTGLAGGAEVTIEVEFEGFGNDPDALAVLSDALIGMSPKRARLVYRFAPRESLDPTTNTPTKAEEYTPSDYDYELTQGIDGREDGSRVRRYVSLRVLPALRDAEGDLARWSRSPLRTLLEELPLDRTKLEAIANDIDAAADRLAREPSVDDLQKDLRRRLRNLVGPQLPVDPHVGIASKDPDTLLRGLRLFVDSTRTRTVADTSLGAANVLYLGMLMEALEVRRAADEFVVTVLGVEEPEAHLHVAVQRRLFRHLLATEPAMLLTTHSPHIVAVAPLEALVLLRAEGPTTVATTALSAKLNDYESHDISRYLDVSRAELLFARFVILVEGAAETYLIPAIAKSVGFDLDEYGVVVVNVAGTDFGPYQRLLGRDGLQIPHVVITDGDPLPDTSNPELGLRRAAGLVDDEDARCGLYAEIEDLKTLVKHGDDGEDREARRGLQDDLAAFSIFVGDETLELDLLPLLGDELVSAYHELVRGKQSANMARDIQKILTDLGATRMITPELERIAGQANAEPADRASHAHRLKRVLDRVEERGKGRIAQRWAAHTEAADLRSRILALHACNGETGGEATSDGEAQSGADLLASTGSARAVLRALDAVSREARDTALVPEASQ